MADPKVVFAGDDAEQFARAVDRLLRLAGGRRTSKMELALRAVIGEVDKLRMELASSRARVVEQGLAMTRAPVESGPPVTGPLQKAALREFDRCMRNVEAGGDPGFWKRRIGRWLYDLKRAVYYCEQTLAWLEQQGKDVSAAGAEEE